MNTHNSASENVTVVLSGPSDQVRTIVDLLAAHYIVQDPFDPAIPIKPFVETCRSISVKIPLNSQLQLVDTRAPYIVKETA